MAVYFIADRENDLIKIGVSSDKNRRLKQLQTGNPFKLEFMGWIEDDIDHFKTEKDLQKKYSEKLIRGEWFDINQDDVIHELKLHHGFIPKNQDAFQVIGCDSDGVPEYLGVWNWREFEIEECCPFCGCLCGMHYKEEIMMYYCMNCDTLTNFEDESEPENL